MLTTHVLEIEYRMGCQEGEAVGLCLAQPWALLITVRSKRSPWFPPRYLLTGMILAVVFQHFNPFLEPEGLLTFIQENEK